MEQMAMNGATPFLPEEIITNILKRLPVKSLIQFRCVCQHWKNLFKNPSFITDHLCHSSHHNPHFSLLRYFQLRTGQSNTVKIAHCQMQIRDLQKSSLLDSLRVRLVKIIGSGNRLLYFALRENKLARSCSSIFLWNPATTDAKEVAISRGLNGIGLAIVIPAIQSLVADSTEYSNRGMAFGWLALTSSFGSIMGGLCSVLLASTSFLGIPGWRISFHLVALISVFVGVLVYLFANDPHFPRSDIKHEGPSNKSFYNEMRDMINEAKSVIRIPSFQIIVAQGISGSFPWSALSFATLWLELIGFSHVETAFLWTLFGLARSFGALFGGYMGDVLSQRLPNTGRIMLSQISSASFSFHFVVGFA
ncbi:hypothetical protein K1719_011969 [Acacia pycnantha]|nr:hypothetical protein K1719_011969 [Acacia pycnantha]